MSAIASGHARPTAAKNPNVSGIEHCPTCEGGGRVVDLRYGREQRRTCPTCQGSGRIDAGVWPYYPRGGVAHSAQSGPAVQDEKHVPATAAGVHGVGGTDGR